MWNFKPNESRLFPMDVVNNNKKFFRDYKIIHPSVTNELLIENSETFPDLIPLYNMIPHWIIKADLGRLLAIYTHGGLYADADCFIEKQFYEHDERHRLILFTEHICNSVNDLGERECKNPENVLRVANFCFGSTTRHHPFLKEVIDECIQRLKQILLVERKSSLNKKDVLWVCGPDVITTVYHKSKNNYSDVYLYDKTFLNHKCYHSWY
jgi:mannosyltransferase OCH1-like enzyme